VSGWVGQRGDIGVNGRQEGGIEDGVVSVVGIGGGGEIG